MDVKSPVLHKLEKAGIGHRALSLRQGAKRWKGPKVLHYFKVCWAHDLRDHPSSIAAPYKTFSTFKLHVTPQLEPLPQHGLAPSLSSHLNILLLFSSLFLFLKHTKPSLISGNLNTLPPSPCKVLTSVFHTAAPTHPSDL